MKKLLLAIFSLISIIGYSQTTGYLRYDTVKIMKQNGNSNLIIENATRDSLGFLYNYGGGRTRFEVIRSVPGGIKIGEDTIIIAQSNEDMLLSGGEVTYSGTGFKFYISPAVYIIGGLPYSTTYDSVTLSASDPDDPRKDVIYLATTGVEVSEGTPAGPAAEPQLDAGQIKLTVIDIPALSTTPGLTQYIIWDENTESVVTNTGTTTDPDDVSNPYHLTKDVNVTNIGNNDFVFFTLPSTVSRNSFDALSFFLKLKQQLPSGISFRITFFNDATQVSTEVPIAYTRTSTNYQGLSMGLERFTFNNYFFNKIRIRFYGAAVVYNGFYLDYIYLEKGLLQPGTGGGDGGVTAVGDIDTKTASPNGAVIEDNRIFFNTASQTNPGLFSPSDKTKLDSIHSDYFIENSGFGLPLVYQKSDSAVGVYGIEAGTNVTIDTTGGKFTINSSGGGGGTSNGKQYNYPIAFTDTAALTINLRNDQASIKRLNGDTLYGVYARYGASSGDPGAGSAPTIYGVYSYDGGKTWQTPFEIIPIVGDPYNYTPSIEVKENGDIILLFVQTQPGGRHIMKAKSTDGGLTYGAASSIYTSGQRKISMGNDRIEKLPGGKTWVTIVPERQETTGEDGQGQILYSNDEGETWNLGAMIQVADSSFQEAGVVYNQDIKRENGNVMVYWRSDRTYKQKYITITDTTTFATYSAEQELKYWAPTSTATIKWDSASNTYFSAHNTVYRVADTTGTLEADRLYLDLYASQGNQWDWKKVFTLSKDTAAEPSIEIIDDYMILTYTDYTPHDGAYRNNLTSKRVPMSSVLPMSTYQQFTRLDLQGESLFATGGGDKTQVNWLQMLLPDIAPYYGYWRFANDPNSKADRFSPIEEIKTFGSARGVIRTIDMDQYASSTPFQWWKYSSDGLGTGITASQTVEMRQMLLGDTLNQIFASGRNKFFERVELGKRTNTQIGAFANKSAGQLTWNTDSLRVSVYDGSAQKHLAYTSDIPSGLSDGDKGDITVSGETWTIDNSTVTTAKISATGTPSGATYLDGSGAWSTPPGSSYTFSTGLTESAGTVTNNLSTGVSGGQSVVGGTASGNSLTLSSTAHATKGNIIIGNSVYDEVLNRLGINGTPAAPLDIWDGNIGFLIGADAALSTRTNATEKRARVGTPHYTNAQPPAGVFYTSNTSSTNFLMFGGGTNSFNAANEISFWTGATNTTLTGTVRMEIKNSGIIINEGSANYDVRMETDANAFGFFLDASADAIGIGQSVPTAKIHLGVGTATAGTAPFKFTITSAALNTTAEAGAVEVNSSGELFYSPTASNRRKLLYSNVATPSNGFLAIGNGTDFTLAAITEGQNINVTNGAGSITVAGATLTKNAMVESPTASENLFMFRTPVAITVTDVTAVLVGGTPSVTYNIAFGTDRTSATNVYTAGQTVTSETTGTAASGVNDATIPAGSWVWITTSAATDVTQLNISLTYTED